MQHPHTQLAETLRNRAEEVHRLSVVSGFDGFVDELIEIVDERRDMDTYSRVSTIPRFAELVGEAAGRSSLREMIVKSVDAGGCAVNLGDGIAAFGVPLDLFATLGEPPHAAFRDIAAKARTCASFGIEPGHTLAMEFEDGKYMLSYMDQLSDFSPDFLRDYLQRDDRLISACRKADLVAITNWTLYPRMTDCWIHLQREVFAGCKQSPWFFIDLVDPRSRSRGDIEAMLNVLPAFETHGRCIFGGNLNEGNVLCDVLGLPPVHAEGEAVADLCARVREALDLSEVAIHCVRGAAAASRNERAWVDGPYAAKPLKSTGAGDRFNAGYCVGRLLDLPLEDRLRLGNATSGFFVRNARSGSLAEIAFLLEDWAAGTLS